MLSIVGKIGSHALYFRGSVGKYWESLFVYKIAIVIATFNSEKTIEKCLNSIVSQKYSNYQVIIQDGCSSDSTLDIISKFHIDDVISEPDDGVYDAWNRALKRINAEWVTFLGSDDYLYKDESLGDVVQYLDDAKSSANLTVYGKNFIGNSRGVIDKETGDPWIKANRVIKDRMSVRHPGCFHHSTIFKKIGPFSLKYKIAGDHEFIIRSLPYGISFYPFSIVVHVVGGLSTSPKNMLELIKENIKLRSEHNIYPRVKVDALLIKRFLIYLIFLFFGEGFVYRVFHIKKSFKRK